MTYINIIVYSGNYSERKIYLYDYNDEGYYEIKQKIFNLLKNNNSGILISAAQISGILNSLMLKSSSYRIENKN